MLFDAIFMFHILKNLLVSHLTVTLRMMSNNRRSVSSIGIVHVQWILQKARYSPDKEIDCDATCWMIAAIFSSFLQLELHSLLATSIGK